MKYVIGAIAVVVVAVIAIVMIVSDSPEPNAPAKNGEKVLQTSDYARDNSSVSLTTQGKLVGEDQRRAIRIKVDRNLRTIEVLAGYNQSVERSQQFPNTQAGYEAFLKALDNAGFNRERKSAYQDERGICPMGRRHIFELHKDGNQQLRLWSTSCNRSEGTMAGSTQLIIQLFENQITDYNKFVSGVKL